MKQFIILLMTMLIVLASCGTTKEAQTAQAVSSIVAGRAENTVFNSDKSDSAICVIDYSFFTPSNLVYRDSVNEKIRDFVTRVTYFETQSDRNNILSNSFFKAQLDSFERINLEEMADYEGESSHLWELEAYIEIDDSRDEFVQLQLTAWSYTGGAHGNGATSTYLIDKKSAKELKLNDVFSDVSAVTTIGEAYFRLLYELESDVSLDDAGFWFENNLFHLNNNFSIVGDKIVFLYNSYEIAPYSGGQTVLEIPIQEVKDYLKFKI